VARDQVGQRARIVAATRVRRGGIGGFFAREHVEVEVQVDPVQVTSEAPGEPGTGAAETVPDRATEGRGAGPRSLEGRGREAPASQERAGIPGAANGRGPLREEHGDSTDLLAGLIGEMAQKAPSSVLDLAEKINVQQGRFGLASTRAQVAPRPVGPAGGRTRGATLEVRGTSPRPTPTPTVEGQASAHSAETAAPRHLREEAVPPASFAAVLEHIARGAGLVAQEHADEILPEPGAVEHKNEVLGTTPEPLHAMDVVPERPPARAAEAVEPAPLVPSVASLAPAAAVVRAQRNMPLERSLEALGLPPAACQALVAVSDRRTIRANLTLALSQALPPVPPLPKSPTSVVAIIGPRDHVMYMAQSLSADLGAPAGEVTLATQRNVLGKDQRVVISPAAAADERRSWRWRGHPAVVAVEASVRPECGDWARQMLRALEPTMCWGVAGAACKPEDIVAWSNTLGGLDALALIDLAGTTSPAAVLGIPVPVGRLDGELATPEVWAGLICSRLH